MSPERPITPTRFERLQQLFEGALEFPEPDRDDWLARSCDDPHLREEAKALLRAHSRDHTLRSPVTPGALADAAPGDRWTGRRIGAWAVQRLVGVGGMGVVHEAVRADDQYNQRAALKFMHRFAAGDQALRRFRAERQILASLAHPNIAVLLDGGVTEDGQPWLAMEYVDGEPITRWAQAQQLTVRERVRLMRQVCSAVQYAHQQLVVHRDLKPGNILVTGDGQVKLLDFGIARLLAHPGDAEAPVTIAGQRSFTPEYAAPEQVRGQAVGTTADVYSLGLILYELVAGRRPFDLEGKNLAEIERIVCDEPPPPARVDADLDAILQVALRKEPERRYGSAELLSRDLQNFLEGRPVTARPDSLAYRAGKLVRRRKLETVAVAFAVLSLVGGLVASRRAAGRAEAQSRRAEQVTQFLTTMLGAADPASLGKDVTVREVLDSAAARADSLHGTPDLEAEVRTIIGNTYMALGEFEAGESQFARVVELEETLAPEGSLAAAVALTRQAHSLETMGRIEAADTVVRRAAAHYAQHPERDSLEWSSFLDQRARILVRLGSHQEAEPILEEVVVITERAGAGNDSALATALVNLGFVKSELGQKVEAESLYVRGIAAARRAYGERHPVVASMLSPYATVLERAGRMAEADSVYKEVLAIRRELLGPEHPDYAWTMFNYADQLRLQKRYAESAHWAREVLKLRGRSLPETHMAVSTAMSVLGRSLDRMDSTVAGERWIKESLALRTATLPEGHWLVASSQSVLGEHYVVARRFRQAEPLLLASEARLVELRGEASPVVRDARLRLVELYDAWGKPGERQSWEAKLGPPPGP